MASSKAHHATGWAAAIFAATVVTQGGSGGPYHLWSILSFVGGVLGGTAPDWLELAWWSRSRRLWLPHRSLTHWGVAWVGLLIYSYRLLPTHAPLPALAFGFACGGLTHLLADWPNPLGVPWLCTRHSLKLWNSGRCDWLIVAAAWIGALFYADLAWFGGVHCQSVLHCLRELRVAAAKSLV